jgi:hypothetical protein
MEKIDLKAILAKHSPNFNLLEKGYKVSTRIESKEALEAMQELWELAVDKCKKEVKIIYSEDGEKSKVKSKKLDVDYLSETSSTVSFKIDLDSLEKVKQMI